MENSTMTDKICDLLFFQYIIKNNTSEMENKEDIEDVDIVSMEENTEENDQILAIYEKYKTLLSEVIEIIREIDENEERNKESMLREEALLQLQQLERDVIFVEKASLIEIGKKTGMKTVAAQIQTLQDRLLQIHTTPTIIEEGEETDEDTESDEENVPLEDKMSDDETESSNDTENEDDESETIDDDDDDDEKIQTDEEDDNPHNLKPSDKIISIDGALPQSFTKNNELLDISTIKETVGSPIEYFHRTANWSWLSSFHPVSGFFYHKGKKYKTVEHAFNAQKCTDTKYQNLFRMDSSTYIGDVALKAKTTGSSKSFESSGFKKREDWDTVRVSIMKECVLAAFKSDPKLTQKLIDTHPQPLHHTGFKVGTFWGMQKGVGENNHGKILMEIRSTLLHRDEKDDESK